MSAPFTSPESRAAFNEIRDFILARLPPGALDRAAYELIDARPEQVERAIAELCNAVEGGLLRQYPDMESSVAFSIPYVASALIRDRLREINDNRGHC